MTKKPLPSRSTPDDPVPSARSLKGLAAAAQSCEACPLFRDATQAVFGEGPATAAIVLVGEQPGDVEDRRGRPFVGPAGALLDRAIEQAGLDRERLYLTNAVKHFKFETAGRGKRRIHKKPRASEITACRPWLAAELRRIEPRVIVLLGTTAARSLLGPTARIAASRGQVFDTPYGAALIVRHPSSVLRLIDRAERRVALAEIVATLRQAHRLATRPPLSTVTGHAPARRDPPD